MLEVTGGIAAASMLGFSTGTASAGSTFTHHQYKHDPQRTGYIPDVNAPTGEVEANVVLDARTDGMDDQPLWTDSNDEGTDDLSYPYLQSSPVIHDGNFFGVSRSEKTFSFDLETGEFNWILTGDDLAENGRGGSIDDDGGRRRFGLTLVDGVLVHAAGYFGLDPETGEVLWELTNGRWDISPIWGPDTAAVAAEGKIFTVASEDENSIWGSEEQSNVACRDPTTGDVIWKTVVHDDEDFGPFGTRHAYDDGTVFVRGAETHMTVHAFDAADGTLQWTFDQDLPSSASAWGWGPAIADGVVYIPMEGTYSSTNLYALDADTGELLWVTPGSDTVVTNLGEPSVAGDTVYIPMDGGNTDGQELWALDADTGAVRWRTDNEWYSQSPLLVTDDAVYTTRIPADPYYTDTTGMAAFDRHTGERLWRWEKQADTSGDEDWKKIAHRAVPTVTDSGVYTAAGPELYEITEI
jgi:outer membrane protein assembly factor BamB